jgi:uncharacterized protein
MPVGIFQRLSSRASIQKSPIKTSSRKTSATALGLGLAIMLTACEAPGPKQPLDPIASAPLETQEDVTALLAEAFASQSPQKEYLLLRAAEQLNLQQERAWARNLLASVDSEILDTPHFLEYSLLFSDIALADDAYFLAQRILTNPRLQQQWQLLSEEDARTLRERRAQLFALLGETTASVTERQALQQTLDTDEERSSNQDALWQTLMSLPRTELEYRARSTDDEELRGWYSLAALSKNNQTNLERQQALVNEWVARWPMHPASMRLPQDLKLLQQLISERPQQIALLLPQQGKLAKAGKAVRDGFLAAYYQAKSQNNAIPTLRFYDSSEGDFLLTYQRAVNEGAQLIVGPLNKKHVTLLSELETLPVPTLAVNYSETATEPSQGLYQFGLAVEDEARQAAQRAWVEGHRHPLILTTNASWGQRSADAFIEEWQALGGTVADKASFNGKGDYSKVIKTALLVQDSQTRATLLRRLFGQALEFEPRRRQDVDMIYLIARPTQARQIKPTLAFHYAGKLPVYASSHIYSGAPDKKSDNDLNGVKFSTLPWLFDEHSAEKKAIAEAANPVPAYQRLYALGVDSYQLYPRLRQLEEVPQARLYGVTGSLQLNPQRRVERQQIWAQIRSGIARPLPMVVSGSTIN